ncbi:MAG: P-type conjugative transfer protein TrbL [Rhodomicrobium sp.]
MRRLSLIVGAAALLIIAAGPALAAENSQEVDQILQLYQQKALAWQSTLLTFAQTLFWLLATIEIAMTGIRLTLKGADFGEWAAELVNQILFIGFFLALLTNSSTWANAIVQSFQTAASQAVSASGAQSVNQPSDIFTIGLTLAQKVIGQTSIWSPGSSMGLILLAIVIMVCFGLITALYILTLVESYVVISAGVLFMGFGGSRFTKDFALKILVYAVSVGAKLFVLELLAGLGMQIFNQLVQNFQTDSTDLLICTGCAIVMLALTKIIPDMIQGLINGTSTASAGAMVSAARDVAMPATVGTIGTAWNTVAVARRSAQLASEQMQDAQATGSWWKPGRFIRAAGNIANASFDAVGMRLSGRMHYGTFGGQMTEALKEKIADRQAERAAAAAENAGHGSIHGGGSPDWKTSGDGSPASSAKP